MVWKDIDNELKGNIGDEDSEVIRNIVIAYLIEQGHLFDSKDKKTRGVSIERIASELDIHDVMITSLAELLGEKIFIKTNEWDKKHRKKLHR